MQITQLFQSQNIAQEKNIFLFFANTYPALFLSFFLKRITTKPIININLQDTQFNAIKPQLEMSFLGRTSLYWLGDITALTDKQQKEILDYLKNYAGPNQIAFFAEAESKLDNATVINCNVINSLEQVKSLLILLDVNQKIALPYFQETLKLLNVITLDQALILTYYIKLIGKKADDFLDNWLDKVFVTEQSLFDLSKYFFSFPSIRPSSPKGFAGTTRDERGRLFFNYLNLIAPHYQPVFWTTFWSEQLFRAYWYVKLMNQGKIIEAKQIAYRLPFSFIQYDWKKHKEHKLLQAHQLIYDIDHALKNGGSELSLDIFYAKFFEK